MKVRGFYMEPWDLWKDYQATAPQMVRRELWKARYKYIELGWSTKLIPKKLTRLAFVLQRQIASKDKMSDWEMERLRDC